MANDFLKDWDKGGHTKAHLVESKAKHTPLQHSENNVVIDQCQNNHINANTTATQSPMSAELEVENTKDKSVTNALNAGQQTLSETGKTSKPQSSKDMAVNANAAANQSRDSLQSTIQKEMDANIVKQDCAAGDSTNTLSSKDSRKKVSVSSATTAIVHEGNTGNARTKASFTPGPWELSEGNTSVWGISPLNARFRIAQITHASPMNGIDGNANARLIAAAPELLEALNAALPLIEYNVGIEKLHGLTTGNHKLLLTVEAAIAKAEGL